MAVGDGFVGSIELETGELLQVSAGATRLVAPSSMAAQKLVVRLAWEGTLARERVRRWLWPLSDAPQAATNLRKLLHRTKQDCPWTLDAFNWDGPVLAVRPGIRFSIDAQERLSATGRDWDPWWDDPRELAAAMTFLPHAGSDRWLEEMRRALRVRGEAVIQAWEQSGRGAWAASAVRRLLDFYPADESLSLWLTRLCVEQGAWSDAHRERTRLALYLTSAGVVPSPSYQGALAAIMSSSPLQSPPAAPPFVGRGDQRRELLSAYTRARHEHAVAVWIEGETGIGKTRLVEEFCRDVLARYGSVIRIACEPTDRTNRYGPLVRALRARPLPNLAPPWRVELARLLPELQEPSDPPPVLTTPWHRRRFHYAITRALTGDDPHVVVCENVQWMDRATLSWWHSLLDLSLTPHTVFVLTSRPNQTESARQKAAAVAEWWSEAGRLTFLQMPPLSPSDTHQLVRGQMAGAAADTESLIVSLSGGNPLHALELVTAVQAGKAPDADQGDLTQAVLWRLQHLRPSAQQVLERLALLGTDTVPLQHLIMTDDRRVELVWRDLAHLTDEGFVREVSDGSGIQLGHERLREIIVAATPSMRRRAHHTRIANGLVEDSNDPRRLFDGATHYRAAGLMDRAAATWLAAEEAARRSGDLEMAVHALETALPLLEPDVGVQARVRLADWLLQLGRLAECLAVADRSADEALDRGLLPQYVQLSLLQARAYEHQGRFDEAVKRLEAAASLARQHGDSEGQMALWERLAGMQYEAGDLDGCAATAHRLYRRAIQQPHAGMAAQALNLLGTVANEQGRYDEAIEQYHAAMDLLDGVHDKVGVLTLLQNVGNAYGGSGQARKAIDSLLHALKLAQSWGYRRSACSILGNLAAQYTGVARWSEALTCAVASLDAATSSGYRTAGAWALFAISLPAYALGWTAEGCQAIGQAIRLAESMGAQGLLARFWLRQAWLWRQEGNDVQARDAVVRTLQLAEQVARPTLALRGQLLQVLLATGPDVCLQDLAALPYWTPMWDPVLAYLRWQRDPSPGRRERVTRELRQGWAAHPHWIYTLLYRDVTHGELPPHSVAEPEQTLNLGRTELGRQLQEAENVFLAPWAEQVLSGDKAV